MREGWDQFVARLGETMTSRAGESGRIDDATTENLLIRVSGDMAWVTFTRRYATIPAHRAGPNPAHHLRIVERHEGQWKFVFIGFLDPSMGRPDASLIRLDAAGAVLWINPAAADALESEDDLVIRAGRLRIRDSQADQKLQAAIRWATTLDDGVAPRRAALPIVLHAGEGRPSRVWWVIGDGGAILFSLGAAGDAVARLDAAAAVFGLSVGQKRVAGHILEGLSIGEIAAAMRISPHTARTHLDRIFEKTGVHNQPALVRILLSTVAPI